MIYFIGSHKGRISLKRRKELIELQLKSANYNHNEINSYKLDDENNNQRNHQCPNQNSCQNRVNQFMNSNNKISFSDYYQNVTRYVSNQIYQSFVKAKEYNFLCVNEIIRQNERNKIEQDNLWTIVLESFKITIKNFISYIKIMPGLNELNQNDLEIIVKEKLFEFFIMINLKQFIDGECYIMLPNGQHFKRILIEKLLGYDFSRIIFKIVEEINQMNMNCKEIALLLSIILTNFGK